MMYPFTFWLENFKELKPSKAQTIVKTIRLLSEKTAATCASVGKLAECKTSIAVQKVKQAIMRGDRAKLTSSETKALSLFEDFLVFREISNFKFPDAPAPKLADYCQTMQMSYSYKAVLIHELACCESTGVTTDALVERIIAFYRDRIDHGLVAEKEDSIFAKANVSATVAKRIIVTNPMQVLLDAKVITWNKRTGVVSFAGEFCPTSKQAFDDVCAICKERLKKYYSSIKPKKKTVKQAVGTPSKKLQTLMLRLEAEINKTTDKAAKKRLTTIYTSIRNELGLSKAKVNTAKAKKKAPPVKKELPSVYTPISTDDDRKVGALVQDSFALLEKIGFKFTKTQLQHMQSLEWSNKQLKLNYAFLKPFDEAIPLSGQKKDALGHDRYYARVYTFGGKKYLVTSQWYDKSRGLFIDWYNQLPFND